MSKEMTHKQSKNPVLKGIISGSIGNIVEWVDWAIYGLAAPYIAANFFPKGDPLLALIETYALFAIGFLIRPIGAMVLGPLGDKYGRKKLLSFAIVLMACGTGFIGLIPGYKTIGIFAPILVLVCRMVQGFAAGGEWGAATAFLYEFAPEGKKAFYGSFRPAGTGFGFFLGSLIMTLATSLMAPELFNSWGWRLPFFFAFLMGGIGLYIRLQVDETPEFEEAKANNDISERPMAEAFKMSFKPVVVMFFMVFIWNVVYYIVFTYLPTYLKTTLNVPVQTAMQINTIATLFYTVMIPVFGWFSDKYNKKIFMLISCIGYMIIGIPAFMFLNPDSYLNLLMTQLTLALFMALFSGPATAVIAELFPTRVRNTAISVTYTFNVAFFGGTAPMVCVWLMHVTGNPISPAFYVVLASTLSFLAVLATKNKNGKMYIASELKKQEESARMISENL